jgi:hypothetical protein
LKEVDRCDSYRQMMSGNDHDRSSDAVRLGNDILQRSFVDTDEHSNSPASNAIFLAASRLSALLKALDVQSPETANLSLFDIDRIVQTVRVVVDSAKPLAPLTPDIGPASPVFEAYRLACLGLLAVQHSSTPGRSRLERENARLKQQVAELSARDATPLLNYVRSEFSISHTDPSLIVMELKRKRQRPESPPSRPSPELARARAKIDSLVRRVQSLEESSRSRDLELEQLKSSTQTVSTVDFGADCPERSKLNDAVGELSAEVARLTADLADEARQKARLLSLVQRQSAALAHAERQSAKRQGWPACDGAGFVALLRGAVDQALGGTDLAPEAHALLQDAGEAPGAKCARLLELVRGRASAGLHGCRRRTDC